VGNSKREQIDAQRPFASSSVLRRMAGSNVVIVSHKPNIMDAFGKDWF